MEALPRLGFDIGGTFTDIILMAPDGRLFTYKILSVMDEIGENVGSRVEDGLKHLKISDLADIVHGTTIGSNAMLEGRGAITGLITTKGFRDEIEIRGSARPNEGFDPYWKRLPPLIPRRRRREVSERITTKGAVFTPLDVEEVRQALEALKEEGTESIAIAFINSYVNPAHEQSAAALARELAPEAYVCTSYEVLPEIREYPRFSTTCINGYLMPVVNRYLDSLEKEFTGYSPTLRIMRSNGGVMTANYARHHPIYLVESGPAAGTLAAAALAREVGIERAVSFDMGGTTVKTCLIEDSTPIEKSGGEVGGKVNASNRHTQGAGYALSAPSLDIVEAGAGGGSIAWVNDGGSLQVGPRSASAVPGPVCYGRGGKDPTITDANVVLGYMNPSAIAGGTVPIDRDAAVAALQEFLAPRLKLSVMDTAYGIYQVANAAMTRAIRAVTTERGRDPRDYTLISFGGAGPIHAADLASDLGINRVYVPAYPGLFSALGLLLADIRYDYVQSIPGPIDTLDGAALMRKFDELVAKVRDDLASENMDAETLTARKFLDLRYQRQTSEMSIEIPADVAPERLSGVMAEKFKIAHEQHYGYRADEPVAITSLRLKAVAPSGSMNFAKIGARFMKDLSMLTARKSVRKAYFGPQAGELETQIITRSGLLGKNMPGPIIVEEFDTTVVVPPGWTARLDNLGNIELLLK